MWPNRVADGNTRTSTPGILSDVKDGLADLQEGVTVSSDEIIMTTSTNSTNSTTTTTVVNGVEEFPILDELDRLAKVNTHSNGLTKL